MKDDTNMASEVDCNPEYDREAACCCCWSRRRFLSVAGLSAALGAAPPALSAQTQAKAARAHLALERFEPKSMLRVKETRVERARFPVIDIHSHLSFSRKEVKGVLLSEEQSFLASADDVLPMMERKNILALVNLTGGYGSGLRSGVARFDRAHPGRFYSFTEPWYARFRESDYPQFQAQAIEQAHRDGARGLKILKTLGLYLRENITEGQLVKIDDPRFDPMWDACGRHNMPVAMHVSDPVAFFTPIDRFNERYEELNAHTDWSFAGHDFPSNAEILDARNRVISRHSGTQFITLHVGNFSEDLANVAENLDRFPNMTVEIGARISELGRQPRMARKFFEKYQDRILFGVDLLQDHNDAKQTYNERMYEIYFRFLETADEYFDYAPGPIPPQGRWKIYGVELPDEILRKVYNQNAARLLGITV